jgi:hypothetical protein
VADALTVLEGIDAAGRDQAPYDYSLSSAVFHPQSDGQTEAANKVIVMYLRCMTGDRPKQWLRCLLWAEFIYNTAYQSALKTTPFQIMYGCKPPSIRSYDPRETRVAAVAKTMAEHDELLAVARARLEQAEAVYKRSYDKHHRDVRFSVGDWVWLHLQHRTLASLPDTTKGELRPRFYGPYRITAAINEVAYRLELPPHACLHVGLLKKFVGTPPASPPALSPTHNGASQPVPERATHTRLARGIRQVLVHWQGEPAASATWEDLDSFQARYPTFQLEDKLLVEGGRDVMWGCHYSRRPRRQGAVSASPKAAHGLAQPEEAGLAKEA